MRWQPHSIAFWDNRCTQHYAIGDYWPNVRSGFRVQIDGTASPEAGHVSRAGLERGMLHPNRDFRA